MKLTVLGSGICIFKQGRKGPAFLIETNNQLILMDCGWGFGDNLLKAGYNPQDIDHVLISHPHADHMGSLMNILQSIYVAHKFLRRQKRTKPLHLHGYLGFKKDYETLRSMMFPERPEPYKIKLYEYSDTKNSFDSITIQGKEVKHNPHLFHSVGYRLEHKGKTIAYSGDSSYDETLIELAENADMAIFEASNPPKEYRKNGPKPNHLSPFEAGLLAQKAGAKKLGLVHIYFDLTTEQEITDEVRKNFDGELFLLHDLQSLDL